MAINAWFEAEKDSDDVGKRVDQIVKYYQDTYTNQYALNQRNLKMYNNAEVFGLSVSSYILANNSNIISPFKNNRLSYNVVKSTIDALTSMITSNKIRPTFLTQGGNFKEQKKAQQLNKFLNGCFYSCNIDRIAGQAFRDAGIFGTTFIKIFSQNKKIVAEQVFSDEIIVDSNEGYYGLPQHMYQSKFVSKEKLKLMYPDKVAQINSIQTQTLLTQQAQYTEVVLVIEAWRLPTSPEIKDGRHTITCQTCTFIDEEWTRDHFPFAVYRYTKQPIGYWGSGIADDLVNIQYEINRLLQHAQKSMILINSPKIFLEAASKVNPSHLTNEIGTIVYYNGTAPIVMASPSVPNEVWNQIETLKQDAYKMVGVSELSAQSTKPAGLDSGKALRTFNDIESKRFMATAHDYEDFHLDIAQLMIEEVKELSDKHGDYRVKSFNRKEGLEFISWKDINVKDDEYIMQIFPTSALPNEPGAKLQTVTEMLQGGFIDKETGLELLDFPDVDSYTSLLTAPQKVIKKALESMLEDGAYVAPEPYDNLEKCVSLGVLYYNQAKEANYPEDRLELLRQYLDDAKNELTKSQQQPIVQGDISAPGMSALPAQALQEQQLAAPVPQQTPGEVIQPTV